MHTIKIRPATPAEQRRVGRPDWATWGCLCIAFFAFPVYALGELGTWLAGFMSEDAATYGQWLGWSFAAVLFVAALASFIPYERRLRRRSLQDEEAKLVQEIHVVDPRVVEIGLINNNSPIFAFDIGDSKILFLQGQWLLNDYGAVGMEGGDEYDDNGEPIPKLFPNSDFTISRFPHCGEVLGIHFAGKYVRPEAMVEALRPEFEFADSELFDGSLDELTDVLVREHERRMAEDRSIRS